MHAYVIGYEISPTPCVFINHYNIYKQRHFSNNSWHMSSISRITTFNMNMLVALPVLHIIQQLLQINMTKRHILCSRDMCSINGQPEYSAHINHRAIHYGTTKYVIFQASNMIWQLFEGNFIRYTQAINYWISLKKRHTWNYILISQWPVSELLEYHIYDTSTHIAAVFFGYIKMLSYTL